jgi:hypothetical protein
VSCRRHHAAAILAWLAFVGPAAAQQRLGGEFQVNSYTSGFQSSAAVASDATGNFVVVWSGRGTGDAAGIFAQRYDGSGSAVGEEFRVNSHTTGTQDAPLVASNGEGDFVVVWESFGQDGGAFGVFGQRYDASGGPLGGEFQVNSYTTSSQSAPAVASNEAGDFVVVWQGYLQDGSFWGIFGQRYDASGNPLGGEFQVNSYTTRSQRRPAVASDADGNVVAVWESNRQDGSFDGVFGQRYDAAGNPLGGEFQANTYTTNDQRAAAVGMAGGGDFVVVWQDGYEGFGGYPVDVSGQRFDPSGNRIGGEFQANTRGAQNYSPRLAPVANDEFVVVWGAWGGSPHIRARRIDAFGQPVGGELMVNTYNTGTQDQPAVASDADGDFVVVWSSRPTPADNTDVLGQRFAGPGLHLVADGTCPGVVEVVLSSAPPVSEVAVVAAENTSGFIKGSRLCPGTELEIGEPFQLPPTFVIVDGSGNGSAILSLQANRCNVQALALATCETSNVVRVP